MPEWLDIGQKQDDPDKLQEILDREIPDEFVLYAAEIMQIVEKINWLKANAGGGDFVPITDVGVANGVAPTGSDNKIPLSFLPDVILGQVLFGGTVVPATGVATLSANAKTKLGTTNVTITLTDNTTPITGYKANEGIYYIAVDDGTFGGISLEVGDWLISTGGAWVKIDNTDAVTNIYSGASPSTAQVGNYAPGTNILGQSYDALFQNIYAPYNAPTFSSFGIQSQSNPVEVGVTISGNKSFTFGFTNSENVQNNSISIIDVTNSNTVLIQNKPKSSPQTADIGSIVKLTPDSHTWRITAKNTQGNTLQRTYTLNFGYRRYAGTLGAIPTTGIQIRTALLSSSVINTANSFSFQSGTTNKIFVVAVENGKKLVSVQNTTTNEDMTYGFVLSEITTIPDAAGNPVASKVYVFQMAVPYGSNCNLLVTLSND